MKLASSLETIAFQMNSSVIKKLNIIFQMPIDYLRQLDNELGDMNNISSKDSYTKFQKLKKFCEELFNKDLKSLIKKEFNINVKEIVVLSPNIFNIGGTGIQIKTDNKDKDEELWNYLHTVSDHIYQKNKEDKRKLFDSLNKGIDEKEVKIILDKEHFEYRISLYFDIAQLYLADRVAIISGDSTYTLTSKEITALVIHEIGHFFTTITTTASIIYKGKYGNHIVQNSYKDVKEFILNRDKEGFKIKVKELQKLSLTFINEDKPIDDIELEKLRKNENDLLQKLSEYQVDQDNNLSFFGFIILSVLYILIITLLVKKYRKVGLFNLIKSTIISDIAFFKSFHNLSRIKEFNSKYSEEIYSGYRGLALLERSADEFVSRYGIGSYLSSGLTKLNLLNKNNSIPGGYINEAHRQIWFFKTFYYLLSTYFYITSPTVLDKEPNNYETLETRLKRLAQNQMVIFKDPNIPPAIRSSMLEEYERIIHSNMISKKTVKRNFFIELIPTVTNFILGIGTTTAEHVLFTMTDKEVIKMLDSMDELMSNKFYYFSAKLNNLNE